MVHEQQQHSLPGDTVSQSGGEVVEYDLGSVRRDLVVIFAQVLGHFYITKQKKGWAKHPKQSKAKNDRNKQYMHYITPQKLGYI